MLITYRPAIGARCAIVLAAVMASGVAQSAPVAVAAENMAVSAGYHIGTQVIGHSTQGRRILMTVVGSPTARRRVMVIGAIHGNERGGVPVAAAIARSAARAGLAYFVITYPNPDGAAHNTRQNARRVDLNRNFPGWRPNGRPGYVYYPGPGPLSEPESRAIYTVINRIRPTTFVTYHQHLNLIDYAGGSSAVPATYARQTGMRLAKLPSYPGSNATWLHAAYPRTMVMTVELPSRVSSAMVARHVAALRYLATHTG